MLKREASFTNQRVQQAGHLTFFMGSLSFVIDPIYGLHICYMGADKPYVGPFLLSLSSYIHYFVFRTTPFGMYSKGTEDDAEDKGIAQKKCLFSFNCRACERACNLLFVPFYFV